MVQLTMSRSKICAPLVMSAPARAWEEVAGLGSASRSHTQMPPGQAAGLENRSSPLARVAAASLLHHL